MRTACAAAFAVMLLATACGPQEPEATPWDTTSATAGLHVALVSNQSSPDVEVNRARMTDAVRDVVESHPEVRLITFGEASLGWYFKAFDPLYQWRVAEPLDGPTVTQMKQLAAEHGVYIAFGFVESNGPRIHDSAVIISDKGEVVAHRRKSNFVPMDWLSGFTPGEQALTTTSIDGIKVALLICADINDTSYQQTVAQDADIKAVVLPQASGGLEPDTVRHSSYQFPGKWLLAPQRHGQEAENMYNGSWVLDPNGYMVTSADGPGISFADLRVK